MARRIGQGARMYLDGELMLAQRPDVSVADGLYRISFALGRPGTDSMDVLLRINGRQDLARGLSCVLRPDILSIADTDTDSDMGVGGGRSVSLFPDGRVIYRSSDTVFQDRPDRAGGQIVCGETSVAISAEGNVIVVGVGFSVVIDRDGHVLRQDMQEPDPPPMSGSDEAGDALGDGAGNVVPFPPRGEDAE